MTVYAQFYGKRTWHIVHEPPADGRFNTRDIATVCGEPSIATNPGQGPMIMRRPVMNRSHTRSSRTGKPAAAPTSNTSAPTPGSLSQKET